MRITLRQTLTLLIVTICTNYCVSQTVDSQALKILTNSFEKVNELKSLNYSMVFVDSMYNGRDIRLNKVDTTFVNVINKNDVLYYFPNGIIKFVTKDSLYTLQTIPQIAVDVTNNWDSHETSKYSIHNILGTDKNFVGKGVDTIRFYNNSTSAKTSEYIIEIIFKKQEWSNGIVKSKLQYDRIWIDKKSLMPVKRRRYSHLIDDLNKESIDIYEYNILFPEINPASNYPLHIFKDPIYRKPISSPTKETNIVLGSIAPDFLAKKLNSGKNDKLSNYKGKVVLLDFWYLACFPCRTLMPILEKINEKYKHENFIVLGVNVKDSNNIAIKKYLDKRITYPQLYNPRKVEKLYNLEAFPTTFLIDKFGHIKHIEFGYSEDYEEKITKLIEYELNK